MSLVTTTADSGAGSLRQAITDSNSDGSNIIFIISTGTITLISSLPTLTADIKIAGACDNDILIKRSNGTMFTINADAIITNLAFDGSNTTSSGHRFFTISASKSLKLVSCDFNDLTLCGGGGLVLMNAGCSLELKYCTATNVHNSGNTNSVIECSDETTDNSIKIVGCTFDDVSAILFERGTLYLKDTTWLGPLSSTRTSGSVLRVAPGSAHATSAISILNCSVYDIGVGTGFGKVLYLANFGGDLLIEDSLFDNIYGQTGVAIYSSNISGSFIMRNTEFVDCDATVNSGAIRLDTDNSVGMSTFLLESCAFTRCTCGSGFGGAIDCVDTLAPNDVDILNCTFDSCDAGNKGGAIRISNGAASSVWNIAFCTFRNNTAANSNGGGALSLTGTTTVNLKSSIFGSNLASGAGQDIYVDSGTVTANNSLVPYPGNSGVTDGVNGNKVGTGYTVGLSAIADNGGRVPTCAISASSAGLNAGLNTDATTYTLYSDARGLGYGRNQDTTVDMGAFELPVAGSNVVSTLNDSGAGSLRQAITDSNTDGKDITFTVTTGTIILLSTLPSTANTYSLLGPGVALVINSGSISSPLTIGSYHKTNISDLTFDNDNTNGYHIQFSNYAGALIEGSVFKDSNNTTSFGGSMIGGHSAEVYIDDCSFADCSNGYPNKIAIDFSTTTANSYLKITNSVFTTCGPIRCDRGTLIVEDCDLDGNGIVIINSGGGVACYATVVYDDTRIEVTRTDIHGYNSTSGAGVYVKNLKELVIDYCNFYDLEATTTGGGIRGSSTNANITVTNTTFDDCLAGQEGGGFYIVLDAGEDTDTLIIDSCAFTNCNTTLYDGAAFEISTAALLYDWPTQISNCTFAGNTAARWGGACRIAPGASSVVDFINCTFYDNLAVSSGGAIYGNSGITNLYNCIFDDNWKTSRVGTRQDTYDAGNTYGGAYSLIRYQDNAGFTDGVNGMKIGSGYTASLSAVADNGGNVETCALSDSSDGADTGYNSYAAVYCMTYDARGIGFDRIANTTIDMGAYEIQPVSFRVHVQVI